MGGKTESEIRTTISNEISVEIKQRTENINKIVNQSTTNISTEMAQEVAAKIKQNTAASNIIAAKNLVATGGAKIDLTQQAQVEAQNKAIIQIVMSADSMQELGNKIIADVTNKVKNDQAAQQSLDTLAKIGEATKKAGGPEGMLDSLTKMVGDMTKSMTGGSSSEKQTTEIRNAVKSKFESETINKNDITNAITTNISNSMKQAAEAKCEMDTTGENIISVDNILAGGQGSEIKVKQSVSIKSFNDCFINLNMGSKIANSLTNGLETKTKSETENKQTAKQELKSESEISKETIQESAIMNSVDNLVSTVGGLMSSWIFIVGGIILLVVLVVGYLFASGAISMDDFAQFTPSGAAAGVAGDVLDVVKGGDDEDQEGGGMNGKIYLLAGLVAMLILIARKSLPLCGVSLVVIILYFAHKKNPELLGLPDRL
jgi:hypothetical protein